MGLFAYIMGQKALIKGVVWEIVKIGCISLLIGVFVARMGVDSY